MALDRLEFFEFGFAYDHEMHRAIAAFLRYLHDLPVMLQIEIQKHQLEGAYELHPDFFRTQIVGDFSERISIYDAFLQEKKHINKICELIGKPAFFNTSHVEFKRPREFGILLRPTKKEYRDFALLLDKLLSDDININFFKGDIDVHRNLRDEDGNIIKQTKGTIHILREWLAVMFKPEDPEIVVEMIENFRVVRKIRQKPAHKIEDDEFDQKYILEQRELICHAFDAVRALRMILENYPAARSYKVPDYLRNAMVWTI